MAKKYFVKGSEEELQFGDVVEVEFTKELEDGRVVREMEIKFTPESIEPLLHFGVIEEKEGTDFSVDFDEEDGEEESYCCYEEVIKNITKRQEKLEERILNSEQQMKELSKKLTKATKK